MFSATNKATTTKTTSSVNVLTITVDDNLILYFDGVQQTNLPNSNVANTPDTTSLPPTVNTIAVQANNQQNYGGILASDTNGHVVTNSAWKCTPNYYNGWSNKVYDDSFWPMATEFVSNDGSGSWPIISGIRTEAKWIWSPNNLTPGGDNTLYCRYVVGLMSNPSLPTFITTSKRK